MQPLILKVQHISKYTNYTSHNRQNGNSYNDDPEDQEEKFKKKKKCTAVDLNKVSLHLRKQLLSSHPHNWELFWLTFLFPPNYIVHPCSKIL